MVKKKTVLDILDMYERNEKITMLTAYDATMAAILDEAGVDMLLVGDTMGMVVLGYPTTLPVELEDSIRATQAVARGAKSAMVIGDLPFGTFQISEEETIKNSIKLVKYGNAEVIKLEGGKERVPVIKKILDAGIPVMGHIGLTPQSIHRLGGFKVQGRTQQAANYLLEQAKVLEEAGVFSIVLEAIPWQVAKKITESINVPTIGIGAGPHCSGQVLVTYDMLGYFDFKAKFVKRYTNLKKTIIDAVQQYVKEVKSEIFPDLSHSYEMPKD